MKFEKRLKEQNFGDWAGKKISEVWKELKKEYKPAQFFFHLPGFLLQKEKLFNYIRARFNLARGTSFFMIHKQQL